MVVSLYSISVNTADSLASRQDNANLGGGFKADGSLFTYVSCGVLLYHLGRAIYSIVYVGIRALALGACCPSAEKGPTMREG